jgi:hypothetical protein
MHLIIKLLENPWFWADIFLSLFGGIIVWHGLAIESKAEGLLPPDSFRPDVFGDIIEQYKAEIRRGEKIVRWGVIIEVVAALGISVISGLESAALNDKAEQAEKDAAQANERAAKFDSDRILVEKEADEIRGTNFILQAKVLELEARTEPRTINPDQRKALIDRLTLCPKGKVFVMASVLDAEATAYAEQIEDVLKSSGFEVVRPSGFSNDSILANSQTGIHIVVKNLSHPPSYAPFIQRAFNDSGIPLDGSWAGDSNFETNRVEIAIGQHF